MDSNATEREPNNAFQATENEITRRRTEAGTSATRGKKVCAFWFGILRSDQCGRLDVRDGAAATLEREEGKAGKDKREEEGEGQGGRGMGEGRVVLG